MQQKIVLIGGPGTGKTSVLNALQEKEYCCMPEISREIIIESQQKGIDQLFLTDPLLFSKLLLEKREKQYLEASKTAHNIVFFDRGIPGIQAYLSYANTAFPEVFTQKSELYRYTKIFHFNPWKEIYISDNERYETFDKSVLIDKYLTNTYTNFGYKINQVPFGSIKERCNYIINSLNCDL